MTPEQKARVSIDALLQQAGWHVCDMANANIHAARGVALREFPLNTGYGFADYLLYIDGKAAGVIEAKKEGSFVPAEGELARRKGRSFEKSEQLLPPIAEHIRIVAKVERRLSLIQQVDLNCLRSERLRFSILSKAFATSTKYS